LVFVAFSGCTIAKISGAGPRPILMNTLPARYVVVEHFSVEQSVSFDYTNSMETDTMLAQVLARTQADAIINMRISIKTTFGNFCLTGVTCGLANARTWVVEGDAIKYQ